MAESSTWTLKTEIRLCLAMRLELWGKLSETRDPAAAVAAWEMILDGEGLTEGELLDALKRWAKGTNGTFPPRPSNLLEIIKSERIMRVRRAEMDAWRAAGCPTVDPDGTIHYNEIDAGGETKDRVIPPVPSIRRLA